MPYPAEASVPGLRLFGALVSGGEMSGPNLASLAPWRLRVQEPGLDGYNPMPLCDLCGLCGEMFGIIGEGPVVPCPASRGIGGETFGPWRAWRLGG